MMSYIIHIFLSENKLLTFNINMYPLVISSPKCFPYRSKKHHTYLIKPKFFIIPPILKIRRNKYINIPKSFASNILLHNLTYLDIFTLSCIKNLIGFQLPCIILYRLMNFSISQISAFILFNAYLKTCVDLYIFTHS